MRTRSIATPSLLLAASLLVGCQRDNPDEAQVRAAANKLEVVGTAGPAYAKASADYKDVLGKTDPLAQNDAFGSTASLLSAQSKLGLAQGSVAGALSQLNKLRADVTAARSLLGYWHGRTSLAGAYAAFDPSDEIARIRTQRGEYEKNVADATASQAQIQQQLDSLRASASSVLAQADALLARRNNLLDQASRLSATQGESLVEQAHTFNTQAEEFRKQAALTTAQADQLAPSLAQRQLETQQYTNLVRGLVESEQALIDRQTRSREASKAALNDANSKAQELLTLAGSIETFYSSELAPAFEKASRELSDAASVAQRAKGAQDQAKALVGTARHDQANLLTAQARAVATLESLLASIAVAKPPIPNADDLGAKAASLATTREELLNQAHQALEQAQSAFASTPGKGEAKQRLAALAELLQQASGSASDAALDAAGNTPPSDQPTPPVEPGANADSPDQAAIRQVLVRLKASEDSADVTIPEDIHFASEQLRAAVEASTAPASALRALDSACQSKFNQSFRDALGAMGPAGNLAPGSPFNIADPAASTITVDADSGSATNADSTLRFLRINGAWKLDAQSLPGADKLNSPEAQTMLPLLPKVAEVFTSLARDVNAGTLADMPATLAAFQQRIMAAMAPPGGN